MRKIDKNSAVNDRKNEFPRHSQLAVRSALNKQPNHLNELYCAPLKSIPVIPRGEVSRQKDAGRVARNQEKSRVQATANLGEH